MARKGRRRPQTRRRGPAPQPGGAAQSPAAKPEQTQAQPPSAGAVAPKRVEMTLGGGRAAAGRGRNRRAAPLVQDADPGIPLDQVPHFVGDLTRLGIVAAIMVVLLIGGAQLIPLLLK